MDAHPIAASDTGAEDVHTPIRYKKVYYSCNRLSGKARAGFPNWSEMA